MTQVNAWMSLDFGPYHYANIYAARRNVNWVVDDCSEQPADREWSDISDPKFHSATVGCQ